MESRGGKPRRPSRCEPDLRRAGRLSDGLGSAAVPPLRDQDHARGSADGPLVVVYADFECPFCAVAEMRLAELPVRRVFRHFPVRSKHPRAWPASCAAEAAAAHGAFWPMHDALFADQGRLEDPHLWGRAQALGLAVDDFEELRRSDSVGERVREDFRGGIRAGVVATPTLFIDGEQVSGAAVDPALDALARRVSS